MGQKTFQFSADTSASPERLFEAASDFSEDRRKIWPSVRGKNYQVHALRESWCDCTEGTGLSGSATPTIGRSQASYALRLTRQTCTRHPAPGMHITPREEGGSHVEVHVERTFSGLKGLLLHSLISLAGGSRFFGKAFQKTLDILERESAAKPA
jgi:hypothetical protein